VFGGPGGHVKTRRGLLAFLSALALVAASCTGDDGVAERERDCTWVLGTIGALSGDLGSFGVGVFRGAELAIDEAAGMDLACNVELRPEDSQGNPDQAAALAESLASNERLIACLCPYSSEEALAIGGILGEAGILMAGTGTADAVSEQGFETWFRAVPRESLQAPATSAYIRDALGAETVAVAFDDEDRSRQLAEAIADDLEDATAGTFTIPAEQTDFSAVAAEIENVGPDLVYYAGGPGARAAQLLVELRDAGVQAQLVASERARGPSFGEIAGEAAEGAVVTCPCVDPLALEDAVEFVNDYRAKYNESPRPFAADLYDMTRFVLDALRGVDAEEPIESARAAVVGFFEGAETLEGVTGPYTWDDSGELEADASEGVWVYEWSEETGDFASLGPVADLLR
jgi:branched-chain amino acid transport system substrate-binding protein